MIPVLDIDAENHPHLNIPAISEYISDYDRFAVVHRKYTNDNISASEELNRHYYIVPVEDMEDGWIGTKGMCYDNLNLNGKAIMSREEMLMNFTLIFGKTVEYEIEYENYGWYSSERVSYMGKIRE